MKFLVLVVAICATTQTAIAQTPECRSIANPHARLACYDKGAQPAAADKSAATKPAVPVSAKASPSNVDAAGYVDSISAEDAAMNARLKNICRGC
jgi:hypothetical protein